MNKTAIRNFAIWARNKLIADVSYRAGLMGITIDGISLNVPAGEAETSEYGIQPDGTFKTKPGTNPTDGQTYNEYKSRLIETAYDQQVLDNLANIGETVYYFFEFPLVYYYHESGDFLGVFTVD